MTTAPAHPTVGVVIVSYNTEARLAACLESLRAHGGAHVAHVVVVDNHSTDATVAMVGERFPEVDLLPLPENLGFAAGCNRGASRLDTDLVLFLNPDTLVRPETIDALVAAHLAHPDAGQIGGRTVDDEGRLDPSSCWGAPTLWSTVCFATALSAVFSQNRWFDPESLGDWPRDTERDVGVVTGCLLLMPRAVFEEVDGFDERYFLYGEDIDLSLRVAATGRRVMITPDAVITHSVGASSSDTASRSVLVARGRMTLFRTRFGPVQSRVLPVLYLVGVAVRAALPPRDAGTGRERSASWRALLRRRAEWWSGYPDGDSSSMTIRSRPSSAGG